MVYSQFGPASRLKPNKNKGALIGEKSHGTQVSFCNTMSNGSVTTEIRTGNSP